MVDTLCHINMVCVGWLYSSLNIAENGWKDDSSSLFETEQSVK